MVDGRTLYINTTTEPKDIPIEYPLHGILTGASYKRSIHLDRYGVDLVER